MKAVVLELRGDKAAILDKKGRVNIIKNKEYAVGQVLNIHTRDLYETENLQSNKTDLKTSRKSKIKSFPHYRKLQLVVCLALMLLVGGGTAAYAMPCSTVTLDINPSISYSLNVFGKVVSVEALNDDGTDIVDEIKSEIQGKSVSEAVNTTLDALEESDYIEEEDVPIILTVDSIVVNESKMQTKLLYTVATWNNQQEEDGEEATVKASAITVSKELKEEAEEKGVSPGKLYLVERLEDALDIDDDSDFEEEWFQKSVKEVEEATAEASQSNDDTSEPSEETESLEEPETGETETLDGPENGTEAAEGEGPGNETENVPEQPGTMQSQENGQPDQGTMPDLSDSMPQNVNP